MTDALGIDFKFLLIQALGFALLMFILAKFAFGPIMGLLQQRQDTIRGNFDEAEARRNEMVKLQHEYEDRLAKIEDEARTRIQAAEREAATLRQERLSAAHVEAEAIKERGLQELDMQKAQAMVTMRDQLADIAVQTASRVVNNNLNTTNHAQLIDDAIANLGSASTQKLSAPTSAAPAGGGAA